jgi:hypothetical protein
MMKPPWINSDLEVLEAESASCRCAVLYSCFVCFCFKFHLLLHNHVDLAA